MDALGSEFLRMSQIAERSFDSEVDSPVLLRRVAQRMRALSAFSTLVGIFDYEGEEALTVGEQDAAWNKWHSMFARALKRADQWGSGSGAQSPGLCIQVALSIFPVLLAYIFGPAEDEGGKDTQ